MEIVKYIVLGIIVCVTLYLLIDTIVYVVKRVKQKKKERIEKQNQDKTE